MLLNNRGLMQKLLVLAMSLLVLLMASTAWPQDQGLRILSVEPWLPDMAPAYLRVEIDYPMDLEGPRPAWPSMGGKLPLHHWAGGPAAAGVQPPTPSPPGSQGAKPSG
jgi:hypothetical protein